MTNKSPIPAVVGGSLVNKRLTPGVVTALLMAGGQTMRRLVWLAILAFVLPTAALAQSVITTPIDVPTNTLRVGLCTLNGPCQGGITASNYIHPNDGILACTTAPECVPFFLTIGPPAFDQADLPTRPGAVISSALFSITSTADTMLSPLTSGTCGGTSTFQTCTVTDLLLSFKDQSGTVHTDTITSMQFSLNNNRHFACCSNVDTVDGSVFNIRAAVPTGFLSNCTATDSRCQLGNSGSHPFWGEVIGGASISPSDSKIVEVIPVPEPSTFALFGLGLAGLALFGRRRLGRRRS